MCELAVSASRTTTTLGHITYSEEEPDLPPPCIAALADTLEKSSRESSCSAICDIQYVWLLL